MKGIDTVNNLFKSGVSKSINYWWTIWNDGLQTV